MQWYFYKALGIKYGDCLIQSPSYHNFIQGVTVTFDRKSIKRSAVQLQSVRRFFLYNSNLDKLDDCHLSGIAATRACLDYTGITAIPVGILRCDLVKQFLNNCFFGDKSENLTL